MVNPTEKDPEPVPEGTSDEFIALMEAFEAAQEVGDTGSIQAIGLQALALAAEWAESPDENEDLRLGEEASYRMLAGDWEGAEGCYRRRLELAEAEDSDIGRYRAHNDLASLYAMTDRRELEAAAHEAALEAARRCDIGPLLTMALESAGRCRLDRGEIDGAIDAANEILRLAAGDRANDLAEARAWILRARATVKQGALEAAERDLAAAWPVLEPKREFHFMAGWQSALAGWWSVTARWREASGDPTSAANAMAEAVGYRRIIAQLPQLSQPGPQLWLAAALEEYARLLIADGREDEARAAREEARSLRSVTG